MPADDQVTPLPGIRQRAQKAVGAFTTTHWSVVLEAQNQSPAAREALEKLCRTYWRPVYGFIRRQGIREDEAEDLTQGFFSLLLERRDFNAVRREKGRRSSSTRAGEPLHNLMALRYRLSQFRNPPRLRLRRS